ncbi:MAG TPA: AMP-binding protein [Steroidobacteraceae bacterium]
MGPTDAPHPRWFDPALPEREQCVLHALLAQRARATPEREFLLFEHGERWTFTEAYAVAQRAASGLRSLGVRPGDRVLVWLPNGADAVRAWFGANLAGACFAPLNLAYRGRLLAHAIEQAGAKLMIAHAGLVERLAELPACAVETLVVVGNPPAGFSWRGSAVVDSHVLDTDDDGVPPERVERWDPQMIIFTSGTTGPSKGVLCTYLQIQTSARVQYGYMTPDDRMLIDLPLFHVGGVGAITGTLVAGCSAVLFEGFRTDGFWDRVRHYGATTTSGLIGSMPAFLSKLPPRPDDADNPLRFAMGPLTRQVIELAARHDFHYCSGFNMTELSVPLVTDVDTTAIGSCGRPRTGCECRIVDEHDIECPPGVPGELVVRNALPWTTALGYVNQPDANARAWRNGWFHTGDLLVRDEQGDFYFVDRLKDAIRRRGENISSMEVEADVYAYPGVGEAAAVGVPSPEGEEEVLVAVAPTPGATIDPEALVRFLVPRMPHFMVPRYVRVMSSLPKTPTNKIRKVELREQGVTPDCWDRMAHGIEVRRTNLSV